MVLLCYPRCSTCKKAQKWLDDQKISYEYRDIQQQNPTQDELRLWHTQSGLPLKRFFNTSGLVYKDLQLSKKLPEMPLEEQLALLATNGMLVKRPLVVDGARILIGFKEEQWAEFFSK